MRTKFLVLFTTCFISMYAAFSISNEKGYVVDRSGTFTCEEVDNIRMSFERGLVEVSKSFKVNIPIEIDYHWRTKNDDGTHKPIYERRYAEVSTNIIGTGISSYLYPSVTDYAASLTDDEFKVARQTLTINLKRTYKEEWTGFMTTNYLNDETSVFNRALKCKRTITKE
jgi:hypothetical protein